MQKPNDINQLRDQLLDAFKSIQEDPRRHNQVKETANVAGKILGSLKLQMEYALMKGEEPDIPFLGQTTGKPIKVNPKLL